MISPIAERAEWTRTLTSVASERLEFCEDFPAIANRYEAWWRQEIIDRPIFAAITPRDPSRTITRHLDLLDRPEEWFRAKFEDLKSLRHVGDALPGIRVDFGPVLLGALTGAEVEFVSDTTWTRPFINDDWSNAPDWTMREDSPWWKLLLDLTDMVARDARGRYLVMTPDLGGSGDVLMSLRGAVGICMDLLDSPDRVRRAVDAIYPLWRRGFVELYRIATSRGAGVIHWIGLWSNEPYMIPACDLNYLIGPSQFNRTLLPDIARQSATVGRAVFHLDGPGATRHIDALLDVPEIKAIQYVPGAGTPSALPWVGMFRRIQARGRSLVVHSPVEEVMEIADALRPEGLCFMPFETEGSAHWKNLDAIFAGFCRKYRG
jgi:hypothetical protein